MFSFPLLKKTHTHPIRLNDKKVTHQSLSSKALNPLTENENGEGEGVCVERWWW